MIVTVSYCMRHAHNRAVETAGEETTEESGTVEWRDLSTKEGATPATQAAATESEPIVTDETITNRIQAHSGDSLTIETGMVTATLVGVPRVSIADLVYAHQQEAAATEDRPCALFVVENTSNAPIHWATRRTKFIGTDGYTYRQAHLSLDPAKLGPGTHTRTVNIEAGSRARVITPVEPLPRGVDVATVIQTVPSNEYRGNQRLRYRL